MAEVQKTILDADSVQKLVETLNTTLTATLNDVKSLAQTANSLAATKATLDDVRELLRSLNIEDQILEYANRDSFPATGKSNVIYMDLSNNHIWRWTGSTYVDVSASSGHLTLGETASTAYAGNKGKANADKIAAIETKLATVSNTLDTANTSITSLQGSLATLTSNVTTLSSTVSTHTQEIADIKANGTGVKARDNGDGTVTFTWSE